MRTHPVHDHAQALLVAAVHEAREPFRVAVACGGCVQAQRLVPPRAAEGMLAHRQQFHMAEAQLQHIGDQRVGQLVPVQHGATGTTTPRTGMQFIDGDRSGRIGRTRAHPRLVLPRMAHLRTHHRCGARQRLALARHRVGLVGQVRAVGGDDLELVARTGDHARYEDLPDTGLRPEPHRMTPAVPVVELAQHRHPACVRRPDRKAHALHALVHGQPCAQTGADAVRVARRDAGKQRRIQLRAEPEHILDLLLMRAPVHPQQCHSCTLACGPEHALAQCRHRLPAPARVAPLHAQRAGKQHMQPPAPVAIAVRPQQRERITGGAGGQRGERRRQRFLGSRSARWAVLALRRGNLQFAAHGHARASAVRW
ncbi:hypothetical protein D3C71_1042100 [compost metagenome]